MTPKSFANHLRELAARIERSHKPSRAAVAAELSRTMKMLRQAGQPSQNLTQSQWEDVMWAELKEMPVEERAGSQAFWSAFEELGWVDWTPASDPALVETKIRDMHRTGKLVGDVEGSVKDMYSNYRSYKTYEPQFLKDAGMV